MIYVNKIENRITFKIRTGYCLELVTSEAMKLPGSTTSKITKDGNGKNVPHLEITEVVLIHFLFVNATKIYQFKAKCSEIKDYALHLGNISKDFIINNMKKKNKIKRNCKNFFC